MPAAAAPYAPGTTQEYCPGLLLACQQHRLGLPDNKTGPLVGVMRRTGILRRSTKPTHALRTQVPGPVPTDEHDERIAGSSGETPVRTDLPPHRAISVTAAIRGLINIAPSDAIDLAQLRVRGAGLMQAVPQGDTVGSDHHKDKSRPTYGHSGRFQAPGSNNKLAISTLELDQRERNSEACGDHGESRAV